MWLENKMKSGEDVDAIICAELPPPNTSLRGKVLKFNIHGDKHTGCDGKNGGRKLKCCKDGPCTKNYPMQYRNETEFAVTDEDGKSLRVRFAAFWSGVSRTNPRPPSLPPGYLP